ncbi:hypothetical protein KC573_03200, partial [candidate division WWE3 bacterium]|nr:hypothetical protein [candidate division WWE3 bacterium]
SIAQQIYDHNQLMKERAENIRKSFVTVLYEIEDNTLYVSYEKTDIVARPLHAIVTLASGQRLVDADPTVDGTELYYWFELENRDEMFPEAFTLELFEGTMKVYSMRVG